MAESKELYRVSGKRFGKEIAISRDWDTAWMVSGRVLFEVDRRKKESGRVAYVWARAVSQTSEMGGSARAGLAAGPTWETGPRPAEKRGERGLAGVFSLFLFSFLFSKAFSKRSFKYN